MQDVSRELLLTVMALNAAIQMVESALSICNLGEVPQEVCNADVAQQHAIMQASGLQHTAHNFACPTEGHTHPLSVARGSDICPPWAAPVRMHVCKAQMMPTGAYDCQQKHCADQFCCLRGHKAKFEMYVTEHEYCSNGLSSYV